MVVTVQRYDVRPDKAEAFTKWATESAIPRVLALPGVVEFRSYRPVSGSHQIAATTEFTDYAAYAAALSHPDMQQLLTELRSYVTNLNTEIWGPSPVVPKPIRPTKG